MSKQVFCPRIKSILLYIIMCASLLSITSYIWLSRPMKKKSNSTNIQHFIAHAGGGIDGYIYTNSKEAVFQSISEGFSYIELDLMLSNDDNLLCMHNLKEFNKMTNVDEDQPSPSTKEFLSRRIYKKYSPLTLSEALEIQKVHPYILVCDKTTNPKILNRFINPNVRYRVYVEAQSGDEYYDLQKYGYHAMLALYNNKIPRYIYHFFINRHRVNWIVTSAESERDFITLRILKRLFGVKIAFFSPSNVQYQAIEHLGKEIDLLYTDFKPQLTY